MAASSRRTFQHGRLGAFEQFVRRHQNMVYNVACRILGDQELACGVTQATFYRSFQAFSEFRGESAKLSLVGIVTSLCRDQLRRGPPQRPALSADGDAFQAYLNTLPLDQRIVLVLSDIQGLNYHAIAQVTSVPVGIVSSRLSRGRTTLRNALLTWGEISPGAQP